MYTVLRGVLPRRYCFWSSHDPTTKNVSRLKTIHFWNINKIYNANILYKFTFPKDKEIIYKGETKRQLFWSIEKHKSSNKNSIVFNHIYECNVSQNFRDLNNQFEIVKKCKNEEPLSLEAMLIQKQLPTLNIQTEFLGKGTQLTIY